MPEYVTLAHDWVANTAERATYTIHERVNRLDGLLGDHADATVSSNEAQDFVKEGPELVVMSRSGTCRVSDTG